MNEIIKKEKQRKIGYKSPPPTGRPKGSKNKFTDLKKAFLDIFERIENEGQKKDAKVKTLFDWATKNDRNQGMFYQMIAKMLPSNLNVEGEMKLIYEISDKFMPKTGNEKK